MPETVPYKLGYSNQVMKWKAPSENTIDFFLDKGTDERSKIFQLKILSKDGSLSLYDWIEDVDDSLVGKIIECFYDLKNHKWKFLRVREDKKNPNADWVVPFIVESINDGIEGEELLNIVNPARNSSWEVVKKNNSRPKHNFETFKHPSRSDTSNWRKK